MMRLTTAILTLSLLVSMSAFAGTAMATEGDNNPQIIIIRADSLPSSKGPSTNFTGNVRVEPVFPANDSASYSVSYVTFEAGARTAWHSHPAGQRLIITAGVGWVQQWGGPVVEVRTGDAVWFPPNVKHWHGASPTESMTHISLAGNISGRNAEWMEKVTDEQYAK
jgi:4-carboxymuconolactone decarboxylase